MDMPRIRLKRDGTARPDFFWVITNLTSGIILPVNCLPDYALKWVARSTGKQHGVDSSQLIKKKLENYEHGEPMSHFDRRSFRQAL
jgi:hypothetical protein